VNANSQVLELGQFLRKLGWKKAQLGFATVGLHNTANSAGAHGEEWRAQLRAEERLPSSLLPLPSRPDQLPLQTMDAFLSLSSSCGAGPDAHAVFALLLVLLQLPGCWSGRRLPEGKLGGNPCPVTAMLSGSTACGWESEQWLRAHLCSALGLSWPQRL